MDEQRILQVFRPFPFQIKPYGAHNPYPGDREKDMETGRILARFLYESAPSGVWDGLLIKIDEIRKLYDI